MNEEILILMIGMLISFVVGLFLGISWTKEAYENAAKKRFGGRP